MITTVGGLRPGSGFNTRVQRLIAKYGLAAHLAFLAVAPLLLFPFCGEGILATVLLWLSLLTALWTVLEPSMLGGESLSGARRRVVREILVDPLFWVLLVLVVFSGLRALNTGIALCYNAESAVWYVSSQPFSLLPGAVEGTGYLPFAVAVAFLVLVQACRHSVGRAARHLFLLLSSALAGLAAVVFLLMLRMGDFGGVHALLPPSDGLRCSFVGFAFGLYFMGGAVALVVLFEQGWNKALAAAIMAIGGTAAGLMAFSPPYVLIALAAVSFLVIVYVLVFSGKAFQSSGLFRIVFSVVAALVLGAIFVVTVLPREVYAERLAAFAALRIFPDQFWKFREALSVIAFKSWISELWLGTGLCSFPLDFRVNAQAADWELFPRGVTAIADGWWLLLAERGVAGLVLLVFPAVLMLVTWIRRLIGGVTSLELPHPACLLAPLTLALAVADGFYDCSMLRADVLLAVGSLASISAVSFPRLRRGKDVRQ